MVLRYAREPSPPKLTIGRRVGAECYVIRLLKTLNLLKPSNLSYGFVFPTSCSNTISYHCVVKRKSFPARRTGDTPFPQSSNFSYPFGYLAVVTVLTTLQSYLVARTLQSALFLKISSLILPTHLNPTLSNSILGNEKLKWMSSTHSWGRLEILGPWMPYIPLGSTSAPRN